MDRFLMYDVKRKRSSFIGYSMFWQLCVTVIPCKNLLCMIEMKQRGEKWHQQPA